MPEARPLSAPDRARKSRVLRRPLRLATLRARIDQALEAVNLGGRANDPCGSLSKGLRQRVGAGARAPQRPAVLFLDEPTSGLDPVATRDVHELIDGLRHQG